MNLNFGDIVANIYLAGIIKFAVSLLALRFAAGMARLFNRTPEHFWQTRLAVAGYVTVIFAALLFAWR